MTRNREQVLEVRKETIAWYWNMEVLAGAAKNITSDPVLLQPVTLRSHTLPQEGGYRCTWLSTGYWQISLAYLLGGALRRGVEPLWTGLSPGAELFKYQAGARARKERYFTYRARGRLGNNSRIFPGVGTCKDHRNVIYLRAPRAVL